MSGFRAAAASAGLGAVLAAVAFGAKGGTDLGGTATTEVLVVLATGVVLALAVVWLRAGPLHGATALVLFTVLAALTALSAAWSIAPDASVQEAGRTFAYLATFAAAMAAARLRPRAAPIVAGGLVSAGAVVCGWALATRVFPGALAENVSLLGARLSEPFGYWNALGAMAAIGVPAALWLGARRSGRVVPTALAYPVLGVFFLTLLLTQSRGALGAALAAAIVWLVLVPLRLRTLCLVLVPAVGVAPVAAWALSKDAFTDVLAPLSAREAIAGDFGLMLLAMCALLLAAGLASERLQARRAPSLQLRRRASIGFAAAACALSLVGLTSVAASDRGLGGTVSDRVEDLTAETSATPGGAARLGSVSSARGQYWRQAAKIFAERPLAGLGANTFGLARLPYRKSQLVAEQAHGFMAQTLADLGLLGGVTALGLLVAWLTAAARTTGLTPGRRARPPWTSERAALVALVLCAVAFGLQSTIDWTWFVPGPTIAALVAAGFVAGRGPLGAMAGSLAAAGPAATAAASPAPATGAPTPAMGATPAATSAQDDSGAARVAALVRGLAGGRPDPARLCLAGAVLVTAALCAWAVWQPERSARASEQAYELLDRGEVGAAARQAERARQVNPYSPDPLYAQAAVLTTRGRIAPAYRTLEQAVIEHPRDPDPWVRLATFELELDLPERALATLAGALRFDPHSQRIPPLVERARAALAPVR